MTKLEKLIYSKFIFYNNSKKHCDNYFNQLVEIPNEDRFKKSKRLIINKNKKGVTFDSPYEKSILEDLDNCSFIKKIKTQSLIIEYSPKSKIRKYYPDIQLLLDDGRVVIIEVKPYREMVNKRNMLKHEELRKYCKRNRFGYAILDHDYYSFEDLKSEKVSLITQYKFVRFIKRKKEVSFDECNSFMKENNITDKQICYIIWKNRNKHIIYQQHTIKYE